jgi:hypothetical protein
MQPGNDLTILVAELTTAGDDRDADRYYAALRRLAQVAPAQPPAALQSAMEALIPLIERIPAGTGGDLAALVAAMSGHVLDPTVVVPVLVRRGLEVSRRAYFFTEEWTGDELPDPGDGEHIVAVLDAFEGDYRLVEAWFTAGRWLQPMVYLMQRADVRRALPDRAAFTAAVSLLVEDIDAAEALDDLLTVLDDTRLIVLHRPTGRGFEVTIGGIGDNFQLQTLLADRLIAEGLPGTPPTKAMVASATDGEIEPPGGIVSQFDLFDAYGRRIWNELSPPDIRLFEGEVVVVLDQPSDRHGWRAGRAYPLMAPTVTVDRSLAAAEAAAWLAKVQPPT